MVSYCAVADKGGFSTMSGHGVTPGMVVLHAGTHREPCERFGEEMTREEAQAEGIRQGYLVEFRSTNSFWQLAAYFLARGPHDDGFDPFEDLCRREELDPDAVRETIAKRIAA